MRGRQPRRHQRAHATDSRTRILEAAAAEFAERGFDGTGVDRIARQARVNKAMIYYHFKSKAGLYRELLRGIFSSVAAELRLVGDRPPADQVSAFIEILVRRAGSHPYFPRIMLRELAERGRHLDAETLRALSQLPEGFRGILARGRADGVFDAVNPLLAYCTMVGPLIMYFASAPVRQEITRLGIAPLEGPPPEALVRHVQEVVGRMLSPK